VSCERLVKQVKAGAEGGDCKENHAYIFNSVHRINRKMHSVNNLFLLEWRPFVMLKANLDFELNDNYSIQ